MNRKQPNLVYVFPDEFHRQAIGLMDEDPVITPNLDTFGEQGLVLTQAVRSCPICSPYRAGLFTGKYPATNGVVTNCYSDTIRFGIELKDEECRLPDVLHDAGYNQGYLGKLHLHLPKEEHIPYFRGSFRSAERLHRLDQQHKKTRDQGEKATSNVVGT